MTRRKWITLGGLLLLLTDRGRARRQALELRQGVRASRQPVRIVRWKTWSMSYGQTRSGGTARGRRVGERLVQPRRQRAAHARVQQKRKPDQGFQFAEFDPGENIAQRIQTSAGS